MKNVIVLFALLFVVYMFVNGYSRQYDDGQYQKRNYEQHPTKKLIHV